MKSPWPNRTRRRTARAVLREGPPSEPCIIEPAGWSTRKSAPEKLEDSDLLGHAEDPEAPHRVGEAHERQKVPRKPERFRGLRCRSPVQHEVDVVEDHLLLVELAV